MAFPFLKCEPGRLPHKLKPHESRLSRWRPRLLGRGAGEAAGQRRLIKSLEPRLHLNADVLGLNFATTAQEDHAGHDLPRRMVEDMETTAEERASGHGAAPIAWAHDRARPRVTIVATQRSSTQDYWQARRQAGNPQRTSNRWKMTSI